MHEKTGRSVEMRFRGRRADDGTFKFFGKIDSII